MATKKKVQPKKAATAKAGGKKATKKSSRETLKPVFQVDHF